MVVEISICADPQHHNLPEYDALNLLSHSILSQNKLDPHLFSKPISVTLRPPPSSCNLSSNKCCVTRCDCLPYVLPPTRARNFPVRKSRLRFYFLQHENLLRVEVVIRRANNRNLQHNICSAIS